MNPYEAESIDWDADNEEHLALHRIYPWDVEDVIANSEVWVPNKRVGSGDWKVIGPDSGGRMLTVVCEYDSGRRFLRPITGWETTAGERTKYLKGR
jgi:hypothetical protein